MNNSHLIISYLSLRKLIGVLGLSFPIILIFGGFLSGVDIQSSVSYYYHTPMHDIFVGILFITASFLFAYNGYDKRDAIAGKIASVCVIGVALIPTTIENNPSENQILLGKIHLLFAAGYFLMIAYFCIFLFTKTQGKPITNRKKQRNLIYKSCGFIILACLVLIAIYSFLPEQTRRSFEHLNVFFWLEAIAIFAFGFAWLVKGNTILKDKE